MLSKKKKLLHGFLSEKDGMLYGMLNKQFFFCCWLLTFLFQLLLITERFTLIDHWSNKWRSQYHGMYWNQYFFFRLSQKLDWVTKTFDWFFGTQQGNKYCTTNRTKHMTLLVYIKFAKEHFHWKTLRRRKRKQIISIFYFTFF